MKLPIAIILRAHGIKGHVKAESLLDSFAQFEQIKQVFIGQRAYTLETAGTLTRFVILKLGGVESRNDAELLHGQEILAERDNVKPAEGRYFVDDLIGSEVFNQNGEKIGVVAELICGVSGDVYRVQTAKGFILFPSGAGVILNVEAGKRRIIVDGKRLDEAGLYEN